jgi:hypothetical protein
MRRDSPELVRVRSAGLLDVLDHRARDESAPGPALRNLTVQCDDPHSLQQRSAFLIFVLESLRRDDRQSVRGRSSTEPLWCSESWLGYFDDGDRRWWGRSLGGYGRRSTETAVNGGFGYHLEGAGWKEGDDGDRLRSLAECGRGSRWGRAGGDGGP